MSPYITLMLFFVLSHELALSTKTDCQVFNPFMSVVLQKTYYFSDIIPKKADFTKYMRRGIVQNQCYIGSTYNQWFYVLPMLFSKV